MRNPSKKSKNREERKLSFLLQRQKDNPFFAAVPSQPTVDDKWNKNYEKLKAFLEKNFRYPAQKAKQEEVKAIGKWIANQRAAKNGKNRMKLNEERIQKLETLPNWNWDIEPKDKWEQRFEELLAFTKKHDRLPMQTAKEKSEVGLARWVQNHKRTGGAWPSPETVMILEVISLWK